MEQLHAPVWLGRLRAETVEDEFGALSWLNIDEAVWFDKFCPAHGRQMVRVASSIDWYLDCLSFVAPARRVGRCFSSERRENEPSDVSPLGYAGQR